MKFLLSLSLLFFGVTLYAQKTVDVTTGNVSALSPSFFNVVGGEPFVFAKFAKIVEGTPYFNDEWMKGSIITREGRQYAGVLLKLDLYDNEVHFQDAKGTEMIAVTPLQKIVLFDTTAQRVLNFVEGSYISTDKQLTGWYQLLTEGNVSLFKLLKKQIRESKPYGSATIEQSVYTSTHYFILTNGSFTEIKKIKDLPALLPGKNEQVTQFVKNLSGKHDEDFIQAVTFYNGLK